LVFSEIAGEKREKKRGRKLEGQKAGKATPPRG